VTESEYNQALMEKLHSVTKEEYDELLSVMHRVDCAIAKLSNINQPVCGDAPGLAGYGLVPNLEWPIFEQMIDGINALCSEVERLKL